MRNSVLALVFASVGLALVGCQGGGSASATSAAPATAPAPRPVEFDPKVDAGVPVTASTDASEATKLAAVASAQYGKYSTVGAAFKLKPSEIAYDDAQNAERLFGSFGFSTEYEEQEVVPPVARYEPAPFQRLSGIVVGVSVIALLEMTDGTTQLIRPGLQIPTTDWVVISIDEEKAVLRRQTKENVIPRTVIIRLETAQIGAAAGAAGGAPLGAPGFGAPGVPPFGPGGPPGRPPLGGGDGGKGDFDE